MLQLWHEGLDTLKRVRRPDDIEKPDVVHLNHAVRGIAQHKLHRWIPGAEAYRIRLKNHFGEPELPEGVNRKDYAGWFAEPGTKAMNTFALPGFEGLNIVELLEAHGIRVAEDVNLAKLPKRIKRALLVGVHAGSTTDVVPHIIDGDQVPEHLVDGCGFASLELARRCAPRHDWMPGDTIQYSYAGPEGLAKGTCVVRKQNHDLIIHEPNLKRELRFEGSIPLNTQGMRVFTIEDVQHSRIPNTDLQTLVNNNAWPVFVQDLKRAFNDLDVIGKDGEMCREWFKNIFPKKDWFTISGEEGSAPPLTRCSTRNLPGTISPVIWELVFVHAAKNLDVRGLKVRLHKDNAVAGYIIPDLSVIDEDGYFREHKRMLQPGEITSPYDGAIGVEHGSPCVVTRNPNAWGEGVVKVVRDREEWRSRSAVQMGLPDLKEDLALLGGADMDDNVCLWVGENMLAAWNKSEQQRNELEVPIAPLEDYIDQQVQDAGGYGLDYYGQEALAWRDMDMTLGEICNLFMNLRMVDPLKYKEAASCATIKELKAFYDQYVKDDNRWADIFCPVFTGDPYNRVPIADWDPFTYTDYKLVHTNMGAVVEKATKRLQDILKMERETFIIAEGSDICTEEGMQFLRDKVNNSPHRAKAKNVAIVLEWLWNALHKEQIPPLHKSLHHVVKKWPVPKLRDLEEFADRKAAWCKYAGELIPDNDEVADAVTAHLAYLMLKPDLRWYKWSEEDKETGEKKYLEGYMPGTWGRDRVLWNATLRDDQEANGIPEAWVRLLSEFNSRK